MNPPPRTLPQNKEALLKSYNNWLKDDVKSMLENFEGTSSS
jgi:mediator of RNA polymerase II transcription subunit 22